MPIQDGLELYNREKHYVDTTLKIFNYLTGFPHIAEFKMVPIGLHYAHLNMLTVVYFDIKIQEQLKSFDTLPCIVQGIRYLKKYLLLYTNCNYNFYQKVLLPNLVDMSMGLNLGFVYFKNVSNEFNRKGLFFGWLFDVDEDSNKEVNLPEDIYLDLREYFQKGLT